MYPLGVSTDSAGDWVNKVQNQLNHVLTQGTKLDESGDWDQQANWTNHGVPFWVRDEKYGSDVCELNEEEIFQNGQAAPAQAPAATPRLMLFRCCADVCARPGARKGVKKCFLSCCMHHYFLVHWLQ